MYLTSKTHQAKGVEFTLRIMQLANWASRLRRTGNLSTPRIPITKTTIGTSIMINCARASSETTYNRTKAIQSVPFLTTLLIIQMSVCRISLDLHLMSLTISSSFFAFHSPKNVSTRTFSCFLISLCMLFLAEPGEK